MSTIKFTPKSLLIAINSFHFKKKYNFCCHFEELSIYIAIDDRILVEYEEHWIITANRKVRNEYQTHKRKKTIALHKLSPEWEREKGRESEVIYPPIFFCICLWGSALIRSTPPSTRTSIRDLSSPHRTRAN